MFDWTQYFAKHPCNEALDWIEEEGIETMSEAWQKCERGDWMVWALEHRSGEYALTKLQRVDISLRLVRLTPVGDGRVVFDLLEDERSIHTIEVAERYIAGNVSEEELCEAEWAAREAVWATRITKSSYAAYEACAAVARAARATAKWAASAAAVWATDAAGEWAASAAASEAAARKAQADIIRQWWPVWVPEGEI